MVDGEALALGMRGWRSAAIERQRTATQTLITSAT